MSFAHNTLTTDLRCAIASSSLAMWQNKVASTCIIIIHVYVAIYYN